MASVKLTESVECPEAAAARRGFSAKRILVEGLGGKPVHCESMGSPFCKILLIQALHEDLAERDPAEKPRLSGNTGRDDDYLGIFDKAR